jgi:endonuclease III
MVAPKSESAKSRTARAVGVLEALAPLYTTHPLHVAADQPFQVLVGGILSSRTKDPTTNAALARLWARMSELSGREHGKPGESGLAKRRHAGPEDLLRVGEGELAGLLKPVGFFSVKARQLREACELLIARFGNVVPRTQDELMQFPGVGRKVAALLLNVCFDYPAICVDTHVHRIANRMGWVETESPEQSELALMALVPERLWSTLNRVLVNHGQQVCDPVSPRCGRCVVAAQCKRVGVRKSR